MLPEWFYHWVVREGSITNTYSRRHLTSYMGILLDRKQLLLQEGLFEEYLDSFVRGVFIHLRNTWPKIESADSELRPTLERDLAHYAASFPEIGDWRERLTEREQETFAEEIERWLGAPEPEPAPPPPIEATSPVNGSGGGRRGDPLRRLGARFAGRLRRAVSLDGSD